VQAHARVIAVSAASGVRGLDRGRFMRLHWQKEPLLLRRAFPGFVDPLSPAQVLALAGNADAQSRLVTKRRGRWDLRHGPFAAAEIGRLPKRDWTVLVQDTNQFSDEADRLLDRFSFIPHARIDDVMVSYAVPGGGVGPHVDSYDVFLLQGTGRRRWLISRQADLDFVPGLPLKVLADFRPEEEWVLEPGDMLYLPPGVAHHGVAESECLTWSIGFRASSDQELALAFIDFLADRTRLEGQYADPGLRNTRNPGKIPPQMIGHAARALARIRWTRGDVGEFLGRHLTEPKAHVFFEPPARAMSPERFAAAMARKTVALDRRTRLLYSGNRFHCNGEVHRAEGKTATLLRRLADARRLPPNADAPREFTALARGWHAAGYLHFD
jgi:50S ribosomal protein L16 3-hydroxylase